MTDKKAAKRMSIGSEDGKRSLRIGRPVLQKATSSAESLISNAPGTGVSQTSILLKEGSIRKQPKSVVFGEPLNLPSPTNPNKPPIIHQQFESIHSEPSSIKPCSDNIESKAESPLAEDLRAPIASP
ncbi:Putative LOC100883390, partial [Caligus rogercresseyi]